MASAPSRQPQDGAQSWVMATVQARDGCVVPTEPLSELLRGFVDQWTRDRPPKREVRRRDAPMAAGAVQFLSGVDWLAQESGLSPNQVEKILYAPASMPMTELRHAEALIGALERPEWFYDGTLVAVENPHASRTTIARVRSEGGCCGRRESFEPWSLTGDASRPGFLA